jgi:hypothetical protein
MRPSFTDQRQRLRRILTNSLEGSVYDSAKAEDDGRMLVVRAHRPDGGSLTVRFRAVRDAEATKFPDASSLMHVRSVDTDPTGCLSLLGLLIPRFRGPDKGYSRVRIDAGASRLEIICQDAEWWEDEGRPARP